MKAKVLPSEVSIWVLTFFPESSQGLGLGTCPARPVQPCLWSSGPQTEPHGLWQVALRRSKPAPYVYIVTRVGGQLQVWQLPLCAKHSPTPLALVNTG